MSTLEKVMQLKQRGMSEYDIIQALKQEGVSPKEINDSLSQSNIKNALYDSSQEQELEPSIMQQQEEENLIPPSYSPSTQEYQQDEQAYAPEQNPPYPGQEQYSQEYYPEYQPQQQVDIETINDIADQISEEKIEKIKKQISPMINFKEDISIEIKRIDERLKRIESIIDSLQIQILKRIGDYAEDIKNISKEMHQTQESFSKLTNPLTDNIRELQKISSEEPEKTSSQTSSLPKTRKRKTEPGFEDYLR